MPLEPHFLHLGLLLLLVVPLQGIVVPLQRNWLAQETVAADDTPTLEGLEEQIENLTERMDEATHKGTSGATMDIFGRIHVDVWSFLGTDREANVLETDDPDVDPRRRLKFRRARVGASGRIEERMLYKFEINFGSPNELEVKDVFLGLDELPIAERVLISNQKRPYGLDHLNSSRFNVFTTRPMVVEAMNEDARRPGIMSYGVSEDRAWNWRVATRSPTSRTGTSAAGGEKR